MGRYGAIALVAWASVVPCFAAGQSAKVTRLANLLDRPAANASVVAQAQTGEVVEVLSQLGDWYVVRLPSTAQVGHIDAASLEVVASAAVSLATAPQGRFPFSVGSPIRLGLMREGPVTFDTARFRVDKGLLTAEVHASCDEGEDQEVHLTVELLDETGTLISTMRGKGGVEEEDDATIKVRAAGGNGLQNVRWFTLRATTQPD